MRSSSKGFTLAEVLLAAGILVFVLCGLLALFINSSFLNEANRNLSIAASHAQFIMEDIKNTDFSSIKIKIDNQDWDWGDQAIGARGLSALNSEAIDTNAAGVNPLDIAVTVTWRDRGSRNRSMALETLITEP